MSLLRPRITGFSIDGSFQRGTPGRWSHVFYEAVRVLNGSVPSKFRQTTRFANFDILTFSVGSRIYSLVRNHHFPIIALAEPELDTYWGPLRFLDLPEMRSMLVETGEVEVPELQELERPIADDDLESLDKWERYTIKKWNKLFQAIRVGDVVFNHWD